MVFSETSSTTLRWALIYLTLNPKVSLITTTIPVALVTPGTTIDSQPQCPTTPLSSRCKHAVRRRWTNWGQDVPRSPIWPTFHIARWSCCQFQDGDILVPSQGPQYTLNPKESRGLEKPWWFSVLMSHTTLGSKTMTSNNHLS